MQTVADVQNRFADIAQNAIETTLGQFHVDNDAHNLSLRDVDKTFPLDEKVERSLSKYLGIPKAYLEKCPPPLKAHNLNAWFTYNHTRAAVVETVNSRFVSIHKPDLLVIPIQRVVDIMADVLDPGFQVTNLVHDDQTFVIDVITPKTIEVEPWDAIEDRNPEHHATVGDVTHGGIRFVANPTEPDDPLLVTYLHRLWCSNGATSPEASGLIKLKAKTVDDVIAEMEAGLKRIYGDLDTKLSEYASLATKYPPGSKEAFARQLGNEFKIPARVLNKALDRIEILPDGASLYDILNVFTALANEEGVSYKTKIKLQELGGTLAFDTEAVTHRCQSCERLLP